MKTTISLGPRKAVSSLRVIAVIVGLVIVGVPSSGFAQHIYGTIMHDGEYRDYILYLPAGYTGTSPVPLVLSFHGWGVDASAQMYISQFEPIADAAGFIVVYPEGTVFQGKTHWNVGGTFSESTTDDVGFTEALIDALSDEYNIDATRIYSTGFSNGGAMSFLLACQLSDRIAAIAPVAGYMTPDMFNQCHPQHPTPILEVHGTSDDDVLYDGTPWAMSVHDVISYWVGYNRCNPNPVITPLPHDPSTADSSSVSHIVYDGGDNGVAVEHFKVVGGGHVWPGWPLSWGNKDFSASVEIWKFFSRYDINGLIPKPSMVDLNGDGVVDFADYSYLGLCWSEGSPLVEMALVRDGVVDYRDLVVFAGYWLADFRLLAHWKLDETQGVIAHDSAGDHDATVHGDAVWQPTDGQIGGAVELDGVDDYVSTPFVLDPADGPFSVFAWVKGALPGQVSLSQAGGAIWFYTLPPMGWLMTNLGQGGGLLSQSVITDGQWHRIGLTWDDSNRILYVDDVEVAKDTQSSLASSDGGLYFGAGKDLHAGSFFSGLIDDVRIYDRAIQP